MTTARLTGPNPDRSQDRRFEFGLFDRRDARRARRRPRPPTARAAATGSRPRVMVARCDSRLSLLIAALSPQRTGHGPTHGTRAGTQPDSDTGPARRVAAQARHAPGTSTIRGPRGARLVSTMVR